MSERGERRNDQPKDAPDPPDERHGEVELDLVRHRGDTNATEEAKQAQRDVPVDVEAWRERDRERGTADDDYV